MTARLQESYEQGLRLSRQGRHADAIDCYQRALGEAPSDPRILFALGNTARTLGMIQPAEMFFRQVLAIEPGRVEALINLANLLRANGQPQAAQALLTPALERNPEASEIWQTLGSVFRDMQDLAGAETHYRQALAFAPNSAVALSNLADLLAMRGENDAALAHYDRALRAEPDSAQTRLNRSILRLQLGDLKDGWRDYAARLKIPGKAPLCDHKLPAWAGASLKQKRLLVTAEQGVGDQLMFASLIPDLARRAAQEGGSIILECEPRLVPLFARSFPDVTVHASEMQMLGGTVQAHYGWLKSLGGANLAVEMGTLPRYLRNDIAKFPQSHAYLDADEIEILDWTKSLNDAEDGPFIGICWRSGKMTDGRAQQFAPLQAWADFIRDLPGAPVCVQYDATEDEIEELCALSGLEIVVLDDIDQKQELDRACALLSSLDAVVSAPTAVSWLAAGAGVPTYKIQRDAGWTSFGCGYEPLAPSCQSIVPSSPGDWADCFAKAKAALSSQF
ncbi:MAG TPA: tetratricopeptide repeat protein [Rhizomicrobium sp.]